jgi:hypothetical protein
LARHIRAACEGRTGQAGDGRRGGNAELPAWIRKSLRSEAAVLKRLRKDSEQVERAIADGIAGALREKQGEEIIQQYAAAVKQYLKDRADEAELMVE